MIVSMRRVMIDEALAQHAAGHERQADAHDEAEDERGEDLHRRGDLKGEVALQGAAGLGDVPERHPGQEGREQGGAGGVGDEAREEGGAVGDGGGDAQPLPGPAPEVGDGGGDEADDDEWDRELEELAEDRGEGGEAAAHGGGDDGVATHADGAEGHGEQDRDNHPQENAALHAALARDGLCVGHVGAFQIPGDRRVSA